MAVPVSPWYENPLFLTPAFGLLGVIVGGLITAGSSYLLVSGAKSATDGEKIGSAP